MCFFNSIFCWNNILKNKFQHLQFELSNVTFKTPTTANENGINSHLYKIFRDINIFYFKLINPI